MDAINIEVINPLEIEGMVHALNKAYGFNLVKDYISIKRYKVTANPPFMVYKMRFKDNARNIGKSKAYRLLCMIDGIRAIPFHLYHKTSGKKPKIDLSELEKRMCKKMVDDAATQKKGGKGYV